MAKRLRFTINGGVYHVTLTDSPLAESIAAMFPFITKYTRRDGEYYTDLPKKAVTKDCPATTKGHRNGLYYFEGWNALSLVFKDCDTAPFEIHHIGDFEEDVSAALESADGSLHIVCELEKENT